MATRWLTMLSSASRTLRGRTAAAGSTAASLRTSSTRAASTVEDSADRRVEIERRDRFGQAGRNAELATQTRIIVAARRGQHHDGRAGQVGAFADLPGELEAVHAGHLRVEQDEIDPLAFRGGVLQPVRRAPPGLPATTSASRPSASAGPRGCAD